jgi:hypothetical protein
VGAAKTIAPIKSDPATKCVRFGKQPRDLARSHRVDFLNPTVALIWAMVQIRLRTGNGPTDATSHTLETLITPRSRH